MNVRLTSAGTTRFLTFPNDVFVGKSLEVYGEWSFEEVLLLAMLLPKASNVVEVGANIGAHTVFIAREVCKAGLVYAFEPRRLLFQMLCANLALNGVANVWAFQKAVGPEAGAVHEAAIPTEGPRNYGSYALGSLPGGDEIVEIVSLDDMLETLKPIALMKVDVEGAELAVLAGAKKLIERDRPFLYVENDRPQTSRELISFISELGYKLWWHVVPLFRANNFAQTRQNIFGGVCSVNMLCAPRERKFAINSLRPVDDLDFHPARPTPATQH